MRRIHDVTGQHKLNFEHTKKGWGTDNTCQISDRTVRGNEESEKSGTVEVKRPFSRCQILTMSLILSLSLLYFNTNVRGKNSHRIKNVSIFGQTSEALTMTIELVDSHSLNQRVLSISKGTFTHLTQIHNHQF